MTDAQEPSPAAVPDNHKAADGTPRLIAIAIVAANGVVGDGEQQPFKFSEDWQRFKRVTMGHPLIVGRRTHDVMGFLPGRFSIIITRDPSKVEIEVDDRGEPKGIAVKTLEEAITEAAKRDDLAHVIGGGEIYKMAWPIVDELDLSEVHMPADGDVKLPQIDPEIWVETSRDPRGAFDFVTYQRRADLA